MNRTLARSAVRRRGRAWLPLAIACAAVCLLPAAALAADTDTVVLSNGDRLHGEVKGLARGRLEFKTGTLSPVYIEWDKVVELTAVGEFEIVKNFTIGVSLYNSYDNRPPSGGAITNDVGVPLTIGWKFS